MSAAPTVRVALVSIGDELLAGAHPDLNAPFLARELGRLGLAVETVRVLPDREALLAGSLSGLVADHDLVITTGGLGPTEDDLTRHAVARALGVELEPRAEAWEHVVRLFAARDRVPTENNRRQELFPAGSKLLENRVGTAHGFLGEAAGGCWIASLPGPPRELGIVYPESLEPLLAERFGAAERLHAQSFTLSGIGESIFAERAGDWMQRSAADVARGELEMGVSAREGFLVGTLRGRGARGAERLAERAARFAERFSEDLVYASGAEPEAELVAALTAAGRRLALAESCTGGLVAQRVTSVAGSSAAFTAGLVTYANEAKVQLLGVPAALIERHGAVSSEVAGAMARGAALKTGCDLACSITGVAGPGGGTEAKPVGLVCFGLVDGSHTWVLERRFPAGSRDRVRVFAANQAFELLLRCLGGTLKFVRELKELPEAD